MKRTLALMLSLLALAAPLSGCTSGGGTASLTAEERTQLYRTAIEEARSAEDNEYRPIDTEVGPSNEYILGLLGLAEEDMSAFAVSVSAMNVQAYGVAAIYPAEGRADAVLEGLEGFVAQQRQNFQNYLADQYDIANSARLETLEDGTVLLVMCEGQDGVFDAIRDRIEAA